MQVRVLFFGQLKDIVGTAEESLDVPDSSSLGDVFARYRARFPRLDALAGSIVLARNHQFAPPTAAVADGDEIALLPPVSGGRPPWTHAVGDPRTGHFFALTREAIDTRALQRDLVRPEDGAVVDFEGVVRNNTKGRPTLYLDYECYEALAINTLERIGREIASQYEIGRIALVHRLGRMQIGETSVVVMVTAPHRGPAFAAALEGINRLKKTVPIWKKEHFSDGEVWVDGEWDEALLRR